MLATTLSLFYEADDFAWIVAGQDALLKVSKDFNGYSVKHLPAFFEEFV